MSNRLFSLIFALAVLTTSTARADDDVLMPLGPSGTPAAATEEYAASDVERELSEEANAQKKDRGKLAQVKEHWGFYIASDFGVGLAFGGVRGYSNAEPFIGINIGYDFCKWISLQLAVSNFFSSTNALHADDDPNVNKSGIRSFQSTNMDLQIIGRYLPHERVALELKLGGGASRLNALPRSIRKDPTQETSWNGNLAVGIGVKYITLLTDVIAGLDITFYYIMPAGVPAITFTPVIRYTF